MNRADRCKLTPTPWAASPPRSILTPASRNIAATPTVRPMAGGIISMAASTREIQSNGAYWQTTYDDVNRITTRIFYSAAGVPEATNSVQLDRRGNVIQKVDAGNNVFTTAFDGLDRAKVTAGPAIVTVTSQENPITGPVYLCDQYSPTERHQFL